MKTKYKNNGFSLTEVLMAVGILSIGLMLVATLFPAALYLTTIASERTMAAIVADGAFAKIKLFGLQSFPPGVSEFENICNTIDPVEFSYPSADPCGGARQYYWSALCKKTDPNEYLVTVFVSRKTNPAHTYLGGGDDGKRPKAVKIPAVVRSEPDPNDELGVSVADARYINPPTTLIDNATGKIYRVIDRKIDDPNVVVLDRGWENTRLSPNDNIWLVPPPNSGGQNADIEVFQEIIRF